MKIEAQYFYMNRRRNCNLIPGGYDEVGPGTEKRFRYIPAISVTAILDDRDRLANFTVADPKDYLTARIRDGDKWTQVGTSMPIILENDQVLRLKDWDLVMEFRIVPSLAESESRS